jgi:hypothetical protein
MDTATATASANRNKICLSMWTVTYHGTEILCIRMQTHFPTLSTIMLYLTKYHAMKKYDGMEV